MTDQRTTPESAAGDLSDEIISEIVARVRDASRPEQVILFGSAATGRMTRDSDIDILVVLNNVADARQEAMRVRTALVGLQFPFDVIVISRDRFEETRDVIGGIAWPAARYGRVIYQAA
ncbi:MAG: nucleotidyltransferase domain-containing protein [Gemmatimonadales bacterium]